MCIPEVLKVYFLPAEQHKNAEGSDPGLRKEWGCLSCINHNLSLSELQNKKGKILEWKTDWIQSPTLSINITQWIQAFYLDSAEHQ